MHSLFDVRIDDVSTEQLQNLILNWFNDQNLHTIFTPNPEFLLCSKGNAAFAKLLNKSDLSLADGVGLKFAVAALTNDRLAHRQTGIDTFLLLARLCAQGKKRLLLFGGTSGAAEQTRTVLKQSWPELDVVILEPGFIPGGFGHLSIPEAIMKEIDKLKPDVIAVALGQGRQERFILELKDRMPSIRIGIGVGGAFDTISGRKKRAPRWMRTYGFEWVWRVLIEPKRTARIVRAAIIFPSVVVWDTVKHRKFGKAVMNVFHELIKHFRKGV